MIKGGPPRAGRGLCQGFPWVENLQVSMKGAGDFCQAALKYSGRKQDAESRTDSARPDHGWLPRRRRRRGGQDGGPPRAHGSVDPVGSATNNFLATGFAALGGLHRLRAIKGQESCWRCIRTPPRRDVSFAERGAGAWMNEGRLRVSGRSRVMIEVVFCQPTAFPPARRLPEYLAVTGPASCRSCAGVRRWGSAAWIWTMVAARSLRHGY